MAYKPRPKPTEVVEPLKSVETVEPATESVKSVDLIELSADEVDSIRRLVQSERYLPYGSGSTRWRHRVIIDRETGSITVTE